MACLTVDYYGRGFKRAESRCQVWTPTTRPSIRASLRKPSTSHNLTSINQDAASLENPCSDSICPIPAIATETYCSYITHLKRASRLGTPNAIECLSPDTPTAVCCRRSAYDYALQHPSKKRQLSLTSSQEKAIWCDRYAGYLPLTHDSHHGHGKLKEPRRLARKPRVELEIHLRCR